MVVTNEHLEGPVQEQSKGGEPEIKEESPGSPINMGKQSDTQWAIEEALNDEHDLNILRSETRTSGRFTTFEEEHIRRAICDFRLSKQLDYSTLADIIQWTGDVMNRTSEQPNSDDCVENAQTSAEFWDQMKFTLIESGPLKRGFCSVRDHIRSKYHKLKLRDWTQEEDDRLIQLNQMYPEQWKLIAVNLGRPRKLVYSRWAEHLKNRELRKTGQWRKEEEYQLVSTVTTLAQQDEDSRFQSGDTSLEEYTLKDIPWQAVANEMGHTRSSGQIIAKWKQMMDSKTPPVISVQYHPRDADVKLSPVVTPRIQGQVQTASDPANSGGISTRARPEPNHESHILLPKEQKHMSSREWPGLDKLPWIDKFSLVEAIKNANDLTEHAIDWDSIATKSRLFWSKQYSQTALRDLFATAKTNGTLRKNMSFQNKIDAVIDMLINEFKQSNGHCTGRMTPATGKESTVDVSGGTLVSRSSDIARGTLQRKRRQTEPEDDSPSLQKLKRINRSSNILN